MPAGGRGKANCLQYKCLTDFKEEMRGLTKSTGLEALPSSSAVVSGLGCRGGPPLRLHPAHVLGGGTWSSETDKPKFSGKMFRGHTHAHLKASNYTIEVWAFTSIILRGKDSSALRTIKTFESEL